MKSRFHSSFCAATIAAILLLPAHAQEANTIKFSDPGKPGTVKINLGRGELRVEGVDANEITVKSDKAPSNKPRKDGLREISAATSYSLTESGNVVSLDAASDWGRGGGADFRLLVPRNTSIVVQNAWGGDITCTNLSGDIEINSMQGEIRLDNVSGGIVAHTMNGEIQATIREVQEGKPLSFTTNNGEVALRLPPTAKASVRLRTQNGSVLTDFEETVLVTKTEATASSPRVRTFTSKNGKVLTAEIQDAIRDATQVSATAVKEALEAMKEGLEAAKISAEEARREMDRARSEIDRARREADRDRRNSARSESGATATAPAPVPAPAPKPAIAFGPKPPVPPISGGKLVTGTLNGGGPEISVATMNGDVVLRKLVQR